MDGAVVAESNRKCDRCVSASMSLAATLSLNNGLTGARGKLPDSGRRYPTSRGTPPLNPSSNPPPDRDSSARRHWPVDPAPETDWPALVRRCLDGDHAAWAELVGAQQRRVYALCYRFTGSSHDAEDLTQDVFIKLYGNLRSFDPAKGGFQTWITTLTRNLLVDHFRRSRQQRVTDSINAGWDQGNDAPPGEPIVDPRPHPCSMQCVTSWGKWCRMLLPRCRPSYAKQLFCAICRIWITKRLPRYW